MDYKHSHQRPSNQADSAIEGFQTKQGIEGLQRGPSNLPTEPISPSLLLRLLHTKHTSLLPLLATANAVASLPRV